LEKRECGGNNHRGGGGKLNESNYGKVLKKDRLETTWAYKGGNLGGRLSRTSRKEKEVRVKEIFCKGRRMAAERKRRFRPEQQSALSMEGFLRTWMGGKYHPWCVTEGGG